MPTYRLIIEYDGTKLSGWQVQARYRTVQGDLLKALRELLGDESVDLQGSGRTDAGVHALHQVASLRCRDAADTRFVLRKLDELLPPDIAVLSIEPAPDSFHARHDAISRSYRYQLTQRRSAFGKRFSWWVPGRLDTRAMASAAARFVGRIDFHAFCKHPEAASSTLVVVEECAVVALTPFVLVRVRGSHFLWGQVRRMVGALVHVGRTASPPEQVDAWLRGDQPLPPAAPAAGLFLEDVRYPGETRKPPPLFPTAIPWTPPRGKVTS